MDKRLKIAVPAIQVMIVVAIFSLAKLYGHNDLYEHNLADAKTMVMNLNLPPVAILILVFSPAVLLSKYLHLTWVSMYLPPLNQAPPPVIKALIAVLLISVIACFWYLVVAEVEMRQRGKSMLRFSGWFKEGAILIVLLSFGIGSLIYGCMESWPLRYARPTDAVLVGLFPAIWGVAFIGMAIYDLIVGLTARGERQNTEAK